MYYWCPNVGVPTRNIFQSLLKFGVKINENELCSLYAKMPLWLTKLQKE